MRLNEIAAAIHADMVNDDRNGYSWEERYGGEELKALMLDGREYAYRLGDRDCSSSCIEAWRLAIQYTPYAGCLDAAETTHNIRSVFIASGLFDEWDTASTCAEAGDLYLNDENHVAMCQPAGAFGLADPLSEFSWGDNGAYGNVRGDQSGWEGHVTGFYEYPWDCTLHYNGRADDGGHEAPEPPARTQLDGIDIASWQEGIDVASVQADFVIVKVTGGTSYVNPYWREWADAALASGKLLGLYHYACEYDTEPGGEAEARYFLEHVSDYAGRAVMVLDWEAHATMVPVSYAKAWLDTVAAETGSTPVFYGYASNVNSTDYSAISGYPLWMASYLDRYAYGEGYVDEPDNTWATGAWPCMTMYQYASTRRIAGYGGNLDVNKFYGSRDDWASLATGGSPRPAPRPEPRGDGVYYRVCTQSGWQSEMVGRYDTGGSGDDYGGVMGEPMLYLAIGGAGRYRVCTQASGWLPWVDRYDPSDLEYGCAGDGSPIIAVEIPDSGIRFAVHVLGGAWCDPMVGNRDTGGSSDYFGGCLVPSDAIWIERA